MLKYKYWIHNLLEDMTLVLSMSDEQLVVVADDCLCCLEFYWKSNTTVGEAALAPLMIMINEETQRRMIRRWEASVVQIRRGRIYRDLGLDTTVKSSTERRISCIISGR